MADLLVPTYEQIATILTKLATNYSNLASTFYDIFYSTTPEDVDIQLYNEAGELVTYTIPNRAKDLQNLLSGNTVPEGNVEGTKGTLYQDLTNGDLYIKETPDGTEGWNKFSTEDFLKNIFIQGNGNPNGNVSAEKGVLYIDTNSASLYIKTTETGKEGWQLISATVSAFADVNLSNLSPEGEYKFLHPDLSNLSPQGELNLSQMTANRSLSNLDEDGERRFTVKENVTNKVTTISASSTDAQYPSAKCMYDLIGNLEDLINAL